MGGNCGICGLVCFVALSLCAGPKTFGAGTNSTSADKDQPSEGDVTWGQHVVQSYQQLQDQQQSMLREIEQTRQDAAANAHAVQQAREDAEAAAKRSSEE